MYDVTARRHAQHPDGKPVNVGKPTPVAAKAAALDAAQARPLTWKSIVKRALAVAVAGALDAFTGGVEHRIDTAEVNGRMFVNNVSLGIYGDAVRSPAYRDAKVRTLLETAVEVMGPSAKAPALDLTDDLGHEHRHPAIVLVSNNPYALDRPLARGTRPALDRGQLGIVVLDAPGDSPRVPGRAWCAPRLQIPAPAPVHAGVDGETVDLDPPLRFASRPASLRVRISPRHPGASPSALLRLPGYPPG